MIERVWFKIGEAAARVGATPKELRYWEKVIPELQPRRSKGNLRYYHQEEIARLQRIHQWLSEGCTVADCRLRLQGLPMSSQSQPEPATMLPSRFRAVLEGLRRVVRRLSLPPGSLPAVEAGEQSAAPRPPARPRRERTPTIRAAAPEPPALALALEPEAAAESPGLPPEPTPKRPRKPKPEASALGRMWSVTCLPLDLDE